MMNQMICLMVAGIVCTCKKQGITETSFRADPVTGVIEHSRTFPSEHLDSELYCRGRRIPLKLFELDLEGEAGLLVVVSNPDLFVRIFDISERGPVGELVFYPLDFSQPNTILWSDSFHLNRVLIAVTGNDATQTFDLFLVREIEDVQGP